LINVFVEMVLKDFCRDPLRPRISNIGFYIAGIFVWLLLAGCQTLGPTALGVGRGAYNDVIARTGSEQTLGFIVRLRYRDPTDLLTVSSVTAGLKFSAQTTIQAGFGPDASFAGNLVPFSAGIGYEDSPTISYAPVDAQAFLREWLTPITMEALALILQSVPDSALIPLLVERMNRLRFGTDTTAEERTAFNRAATLLAHFRERGIASWAQQSDKSSTTPASTKAETEAVELPHIKQYELVLSNYSPTDIADVEELLRLLDLHGDPAHESIIRIPVVVGVRDVNFDGLAIQTRSVAVIMRTAAASVDVPQEHIEKGIVNATAQPPAVLMELGSTLHIQSSRSAPERANVAVHHRGWWYYVDDADLNSKTTFVQIQMLFLTRLSEATRGIQATPLLTIPVK